MTTMTSSLVRRSLGAFVIGSVLSATALSAPASASETAGHYQIPRLEWTFGGLSGYFDKQQLRRGFKVYQTVCQTCHNLAHLSYRNLTQPGGPELPKEEVEAYAAQKQVADGFNDAGEVNMRPAKLADLFVGPFKNDKEAAAALNGAVPPDLSLITKARTVEREVEWYAFPFVMLKDVLTQYQEQGADYVHALLNGYMEPPATFNLLPGLSYNRVFPGHQIGMPQPLTDGAVDYDDGTPTTLDQQSKDVTAFLAWAAEPTLADRKKLGAWVLIYLIILAGLLYASKKLIWRNVKH
ncbi:cytochrome c1 [Rhodomicrobium vannielii ATCC 17100]|uniref:Cytochrome c1 n=1 Tax=Rhodomicrobium vannielii (strain ATCC 17100 / DSM 162 / LMG 4299 / NCIMB 10020 / ATH 3.1.1) TaxID=648757 RepID=E3I5A5_RHOVT|nr:cytochrome c1 [Rhodomicrobium vannielii]ADP70555.1 cytochrome c1 [Rhodomicrobium vannielii ATCC 17100]